MYLKTWRFRLYLLPCPILTIGDEKLDNNSSFLRLTNKTRPFYNLSGRNITSHSKYKTELLNNIAAKLKTKTSLIFYLILETFDSVLTHIGYRPEVLRSTVCLYGEEIVTAS